MNKIILKHSTVPGKIPTPDELSLGEIAINIADGRLFAKIPSGEIKEFAKLATIKSFAGITGDVGSIEATAPAESISVKGGAGVRVTAMHATNELVIALNNADAATLGGHAPSHFATASHLHDDRYLKLQAQGGDYYTQAQVNSQISSAIDNLVGGASSAFDTLKELEDALKNKGDAVAAINATLATKLDASAYTADDVLAKLKTVHGVSSGLDAALLAGQSSAFYRNAGNLNAGTVPVARLSGIYNIGISGNAATATKLASSYTLSLAGHASGSVSMDGSANATLSVTVANDSHTHDARYYEKSQADGRYGRISEANTWADTQTFGTRALANSDSDAAILIAGRGVAGERRVYMELQGALANDATNEGGGAFIKFRTSTSANYGPEIGAVRRSGGNGDMIIRTGGNSVQDRLTIRDNGDIFINKLNGIVKGAALFDTGHGKGLDADTLDGQHGDFYRNWTNVTNKPSPTITLSGDVDGSVTLGQLSDGNLSVTVLENSHNHTMLERVVEIAHESGVRRRSASTFTNSTTAAELMRFDAIQFGSAEVTIHAASGSKRQLSKVLLVQDGSMVHATEYGVLATDGEMFTVIAEVALDEVIVWVKPESSIATSFRASIELFEV